MKKLSKRCLSLLLTFALLAGCASAFPARVFANEKPEYLSGDVTGDGAVTAADARLALRAAVGLETYAPGSREFLAADADENGEINAADARYILRAAVGLELLPVVPDPRSDLTPTERERLKANLPVMDGSTSMIPLDAAVRSALYGISYDEAKAQVKHNKTWGAFYGMLINNVDLLLTTPLSEDQKEYAGEENVSLTEVPITKEGFVFVVNAKNPVDTLTQQQLKDIYSGKITNWKELGGEDAEIIAYQRNRESGSQNFMIDFMGDTPLMDAPTELRPGEMGYLMDAIAINDNAENAIGYSVYTYAADMYRDAENTKFIKVDGVAPSRAAMASGEYPLTAENYAVYNNDSPRLETTLLLLKFLLSEEGQTAIADAGYVAIRDIGYDYSEETPSARYKGVGCGGKAPETLSSIVFEDVYYDGFIEFPRTGKLADGTPCYEAPDGFKDAALRSDVNAFLREAYTELNERAKPFNDELYAKLKKDLELEDLEDDEIDWSVLGGLIPEGASIAVDYEIRNAYFSIVMRLSLEGFDSYVWCADLRTCVWDLRTGKRVAPEELFYDGVDIGSVLSYCVNHERINHLYGNSSEMFILQGEPGVDWFITASGLYFPESYDYFSNGDSYYLEDLPAGTMTAEVSYDPGQKLDPTVFPFDAHCVAVDYNISYYAGEDEGEYPVLDETVYPHAKEINAQVKNYLQAHFSEEGLQEYYGEQEYFYQEFTHMRAVEILGRYYVIQLPMIHLYVKKPNASPSDPVIIDYESAYPYYPYSTTLLFDVQTGEQVQWTDLLADDWKEQFEWDDGSEAVPDDTLKTLRLVGFSVYGRVSVLLVDGDGMNLVQFNLPATAFTFADPA